MTCHLEYYMSSLNLFSCYHITDIFSTTKWNMTGNLIAREEFLESDIACTEGRTLILPVRYWHPGFFNKIITMMIVTSMILVIPRYQTFSDAMDICEELGERGSFLTNFQSYNEYLQLSSHISYLSHICLIFVSYLSHIYLIFVLHLSHICLIFVSYLSYICHNLSSICLIFVPYLYHIIFVSYLSHIYFILSHIGLLFASYLSHICIIFVSYLLQFVIKYLSHICLIFTGQLSHQLPILYNEYSLLLHHSF